MGDHWGGLCATTELASVWADQLLLTQRSVLRERKRGTYAFFSGTTLCYSALFKAGQQGMRGKAHGGQILHESSRSAQ